MVVGTPSKLSLHKQEKTAREAQAKADALDAAVFDLKAVNPNAVVKIDCRTPKEVIQSIVEQGEIVAQALESLRALLQPQFDSKRTFAEGRLKTKQALPTMTLASPLACSPALQRRPPAFQERLLNSG